MREIFIYGIRKFGAGSYLYVGSTSDFARRRAIGYANRVQSVLNRIAWEYVILETTCVAESAEREQYWIDELRRSGHRLLNTNRARKNNSRSTTNRVRATDLGPVAPNHRCDAEYHDCMADLAESYFGAPLVVGRHRVFRLSDGARINIQMSPAARFLPEQVERLLGMIEEVDRIALRQRA